MKRFLLACSCFLCWQCANAQTRHYADRVGAIAEADGSVHKGQFIDVDLAEGKRLFIRYSTISDSGVELDLAVGTKEIWRVYVEGLGISHRAYHQDVSVELDPQDKERIDITIAGRQTINETRSLKTGEQLSRSITDNRH